MNVVKIVRDGHTYHVSASGQLHDTAVDRLEQLVYGLRNLLRSMRGLNKYKKEEFDRDMNLKKNQAVTLWREVVDCQ